MRRFTLPIIALLITILLLSTMSASETTQIDLNTKVRIGLKSIYEKVPSITISNQSLLLGFEVSSEYLLDHELTSTTGFIITPASGYYLVSQEYYDSFSECETQVNVLKGAGQETNIGLAAHGIWKIYIGSVTSSDAANTLYSSLEGVNGIHYDIVADNGLRTQVDYSSGNAIILENSGSTVQLGTNTLKDGVPVLNMGVRSYRGKMEIGRFNKEGVTAISVLPLNEYLYGVVPSEMPPSWPIEALKAQAVAARNFVMYYTFVANKYPHEAYTLCDTTSSQAYKGFSAEVAKCNQAVDETTGKLIYYNGIVISANFSSTSGGHTEDSENVWVNATPYLRGVPDIYESDPYAKPWIETRTAADIKAGLAKYNVNIGDITDIRVLTYTDSGRAMTVNVIGTLGSYEISKDSIRTYFGLKSRKFTLVKNGFVPQTKFVCVDASDQTTEVVLTSAAIMNGSNTSTLLNADLKQISIITSQNIYSMPNFQGQSGTYSFVGQGFGHGVGMSQSGAKGMALAGFTYDEILEYYYTGTVVE